jgi:hypothetical protein
MAEGFKNLQVLFSGACRLRFSFFTRMFARLWLHPTWVCAGRRGFGLVAQLVRARA